MTWPVFRGDAIVAPVLSARTVPVLISNKTTSDWLLRCAAQRLDKERDDRKAAKAAAKQRKQQHSSESSSATTKEAKKAAKAASKAAKAPAQQRKQHKQQQQRSQSRNAAVRRIASPQCGDAATPRCGGSAVRLSGVPTLRRSHVQALPRSGVPAFRGSCVPQFRRFPFADPVSATHSEPRLVVSRISSSRTYRFSLFLVDGADSLMKSDYLPRLEG